MRLPFRPFASRTLRALLLAFLVGSGPVAAATASYSILLDTDSNATTGCNVAGPAGPVAGIEQVATTVVDTTSTGGAVTRLERQVCSGSVMGAPSTYDPGGWAIGFGNGNSGTAVVESSIPLAMLPPGASMRAVAVSQGGGGQDATASFAITLQAVGGPGNQVVAVPLSPWLVLPLALGIFGVAVWVRRRYPHHAGVAAILVVFALSGLAWAATVIRDGNIGDWSGVLPAVTDAGGSAPPTSRQISTLVPPSGCFAIRGPIASISASEYGSNVTACGLPTSTNVSTWMRPSIGTASCPSICAGPIATETS